MSETKQKAAVVTLSGRYYLADKKGTKEFSGIKMSIPEDKACVALATCMGVMKKHLRKYFPDAVRMTKLFVDHIDCSSFASNGKPVEVMDLAELMYVIEDKDLRINVREFASLLELRHVVKLYLANEDEALVYVKANRKRYREEQELIELNPDLASSDYLNPDKIDEVKKVKAQKPAKNFHKAKVADLEAPDDAGDTDPNTGKELAPSGEDDEDPEELRQRLLNKVRALGLSPNVNTGVAKLRTILDAHKEDDELDI